MDELLLESSGSGGRNTLVKYSGLVVTGVFLLATMISLVVWSVRLGSFQNGLQEAVQLNDVAAKKLQMLNYNIKRCLEGMEVNGACLETYTIKVGYETARTKCIERNGDLVSAASDLKLKNIVEFIKSYGLEGPLWLGGQYNHNHLKWEWVNGIEIPIKRPPWATTQPQGDNEHCVALDTDDLLHDYPCNHELPYICTVPYL